MEISIVIPTYNVVELLRKNLPQVIDSIKGFPNIELVVSDNHSSDETITYLKKLQKESPIRIVILKNSFNGGFAVNANMGVKKAKGKIVVLLGSDVIPSKNFLKPLLKHFDNKELFAVGCANKSDDDAGKIILRGRGIGKWEKGFLIHSKGEMINDQTLWVDCGSGAFRKSIWNEIGGLQELYRPFYWEDIDLSYRAQKMGYALKIEKASLVYHEHKKGSIKKMEKPDYVTKIAYRNQFFFVWLNITDIKLLLNHFLYLPYHLLSAFKNRNFIFIEAFFMALLKLPEVLRERRKNSNKFKVADNIILQKFRSEYILK